MRTLVPHSDFKNKDFRSNLRKGSAGSRDGGQSLERASLLPSPRIYAVEAQRCVGCVSAMLDAVLTRAATLGRISTPTGVLGVPGPVAPLWTIDLLVDDNDRDLADNHRDGDAAHAISPAGAAGVNYAIADAVATANLLAPPLRTSSLPTADLRHAQRRREPALRRAQALRGSEMLPRLTGSRRVAGRGDQSAARRSRSHLVQRVRLRS